MSEETLFFGLAGLVCIGLFLNGLRFARMTHNPWAGKTLFGQPVSGSEMPVSKMQAIGKIHMSGAVLFAAFLIAAYAGLFGPIDIQTR